MAARNPAGRRDGDRPGTVAAADLVPWEDAFRALAANGYTGPISVEWDDAGMDRLHGAAEAVRYIRSLLWTLPGSSFDAAFSNQ